MAASKLQLIGAPLSPALAPSIRAGAYPPLHLVSLASYVAARLPDCQIEILDGELLTVEEIIAELDSHADWIGISANTLTYDTAVQIAEAAQELGLKVVLGGAHAQFAAREILSNRNAFDAVVIGDGEQALYRLLTGDAIDTIPNVAFLSSGQVMLPPETRVPFEVLPLPDYGLVPVRKYFTRYQTLYPEKPFRGAFTIFSAKGCQWRERTRGGCVFCSIQHIGFRIKPPVSVWREIRHLNTEYGADLFWDVSDTFTMQRKWVHEFAQVRPDDMRVGFHVYGRPSDVNDTLADDLLAMGTYEVFVGLEAGSNQTLKTAFKGTSFRQNLRAVRVLNSRGIRVVASIILGLPGETKASLESTLDMCRRLTTEADLSEMHCSVLLPLPGSGVMRTMLQVPDFRQRYAGKDLLDLEALRTDWVRQFCSVEYDDLLRAQEEILRMGLRAGSFGRTQRPPALSDQSVVRQGAGETTTSRGLVSSDGVIAGIREVRGDGLQ